ncbi:OmpA family protein [Polyangium aurulentum]|uniref:OmpA family protein n=1 Tax=Polyangium aurulentum TaxID=2567896 RepID=UPI0010AE204F|nr:OmpA family protein [Polyangium aurulentum]UQA59068.1 OmpA family protein [Polyangium aurulentum]
MPTLENASFAAPLRLAALTALPLLAICLGTSEVAAQQPGPPPPGQPGQFQPPPGQFQPPPGQFQPAPGQFQPPPGQFQPAPGQFQPPPGQFQPAPGQFQPPPGQFQPPPGQFQAPPGQFQAPPGQFQAPPGQFQPPPGQSGPQPPPSGARGQISAELDTATPAPKVDADEERARTLIEQPNMYGGTGLLRTSYAGSGAAGTFRVAFLSDWFTSSNFLCDPAASTAAGQPVTCSRENNPDSASHVGAFFSLSATPFSFLEAFASIRTFANANDQGKPKLLQVLGDTTFGLKAFTPSRVGNYFSFGAEAQLILLNGTGSVGVAGAGTSANFRALASMDFRKPGGQGFPLRINVNLGYKVDNSGQVVKEVEAARALEYRDGRDRQPISRIERFGLGINRVDFFQPYIGVEVPLRWLQPYLEYTVDVPVNRQGYECHTGRVSRGDVCLGLADFANADPATAGGPGYAGIPSRLTIGTRVTPFNKAFRGLSAHLGVDIGLSATSVFIEEVAPQAPWTLYAGLAYAFDTKEKEIPPPPPAPKPLPPPPPQLIPIPVTFVRGLVHEQGKPESLVADAIVSLQGSVDPPFATGGEGAFLTRDIKPGTYTFDVKAPGYKPGTCQVTVPDAPPPTPGTQPMPSDLGPLGPTPNPQGPPTVGGQFGVPMGGQPGGFAPQGGQPQGAPLQPGQYVPPQPPPAQQPAQVPLGAPVTIVNVDCFLEAIPKVGAVSGTVRDAETGEPIAGAVVRLVDSTGKELTATADGNGAISFRDLPPGHVTLRSEAAGFMNHLNEADVRAMDEVKVALAMNKRPAARAAQVKVQGNEIKISRQVHFETDSAKILGDSNTLLEEIADVLQQNQKIKKVEIQGHTDSTGGRERNQTLSDQRANSVRNWLIQAGVDGNRLVAKGYGQDKPLVPNVTPANRAKNRRVQFIILQK